MLPSSRLRAFGTGAAVAAAAIALVAAASHAQTYRAPPEVPPALPTSGPQAQTIAGPAETQKIAVDIHETVDKVPVTVRLPNGTAHTGVMVITHFRPAGAGPFPAIVINHGRSAANRAEPGRWRYLPIVRYWVRRGFAVLVPTRMGYGELGQAVDPEYSGVCSNPDYAQPVDAMATQIAKAAEFASQQSWIDGRRVLLLGISYGGVGVLAATARKPAGVIGAINFSGGLGGNPERRPGDPCQGQKIGGIIADAGAHARLPTLWLYADNDRYWGAEWPRRWHEAYTKAGGKAELAAFAPIGEDGHKLVGTGFSHWRPVVDDWLGKLGFDVPVAATKLPASGYARLEETRKVPFVREPTRTDAYSKFLSADVPRAFAVSPTGAWAWRSGADAVELALSRCQIHSRVACRLYAVDDRVVWKIDQR